MSSTERRITEALIYALHHRADPAPDGTPTCRLPGMKATVLGAMRRRRLIEEDPTAGPYAIGPHFRLTAAGVAAALTANERRQMFTIQASVYRDLGERLCADPEAIARQDSGLSEEHDLAAYARTLKMIGLDLLARARELSA